MGRGPAGEGESKRSTDRVYVHLRARASSPRCYNSCVSTSDSDDEAREHARQARAELRRRSWTGGVVTSFAQMEEADLAFWLAATVGERIRAVTQLNDELRAIRGESGPSPRLQRTIGGTRPR